MKLYSLLEDNGKTVYYSNKVEAMERALSMSRENVHVNEVFSHVLLEKLSPRDRYAALLNGKGLINKVVLAAYRKGHKIRGWVI